MAAGASPTIYDPKVLYKGLLTTTLTTTLVTAPNEAGVKIERIVLTNEHTVSIDVTIDHADTGGANDFNIMAAASIRADGYPVVLELGIYLNATDLLRGGAATGAKINCLIYGLEMKD